MNAQRNPIIGQTATLVCAIWLLLACAAPLAAQGFNRSIVTLSQSDAVRKVYAPVVREANRSVVQVMVDGAARVLGTVIAEDLVVTKYSELARKVDAASNLAKFECRQGDNTWPASQLAFDRPSDLALLRLHGAKLPTVQWQAQAPAIGAFLASPDGSPTPLGIGILASQPYQHTRERAFLGIRFANPNGGPAKIAEVVAHGAARAAGLLDGDTVVQFGEQKIQETQELRDSIRQCRPGDTITVTVTRDGNEHSFVVKLGTNNSAIESGQEDVWGELSEVRSGFQQILQHDTVLLPNQCGGPVVDLTGKVLGINIARAGRVETLALPATVVQQLVKRLQTATQPGGKPAQLK